MKPLRHRILAYCAAFILAAAALAAFAQQGRGGNPADREARRAEKMQRQQGAGKKGGGGKKGGSGGGRKSGGGRRGEGGGGGNRELVLPAEAAAQTSLSLVLGRPTASGITVSVLTAMAHEGYIEYGTTAGKDARKTEVSPFPAGTPVEVLLDKLPANTEAFYRLCLRQPGQATFAAGPEGRFHTQRAPGSPFTFEIQGDSHPERPQQFDAGLYVQTLRAAATDRPDFYLAIGDDFSADKLGAASAPAVSKVYLTQRYFLSLLAQTTPLFLVNGNHEQAALANLDGTPNNVAVWAQTARSRYFPQPAPDGFYTGNDKPVEHIGPLRDYYAWTWGDALFVVIDPYWHSPQPVDNVYGGGEKRRDMWAVTLGEEQYRWFKEALETSKAKYKFVFSHHVLGTGRGGIELAGNFEWGGKGKDGVDEFAKRRPGWEAPIHQLMAKSGVTIFFQGHDHIFVRQQLDGVTYQTLPEPADPNFELYNKEAYRSGDALPNSGRVRVRVAQEKVSVEYIRSRLPKDATAEHPDGEVAFRYEISGKEPRQ